MPSLVSLHDKAGIEAFVRKKPLVHLFEVGDLDERYWPWTTWYGWRDSQDLRQLALIYHGPQRAVLMANADPPREEMRAFLTELLSVLPRRLYAHLDPAVVDVLAAEYYVESRGLHWKMGLADPSRLAAVDTSDVVQLSDADLDDLLSLYDQAYPASQFDPRTLQTRSYFGIRQDKALVSVAGVHVYSPVYQVAALGNVATHPSFRRRGLATKVSAALCKALVAEGIAWIGLVVKADNTAAIAAYSRLGFERVAEFGSYVLTAR